MTDIRTLIADDDPGMRSVIRKIVERTDGFSLIGEAQDGDELLRLHEEHQPELIILDVEMPELTGIECAKIIQDRNPKTVLIFATAHEQYMMDAFEVYAFDFLLKPFKVDRAMKTLGKVKERLRAPVPEVVPTKKREVKQDRLMIKGKDGMNFVDLDKLLLAQREDRQTALYAEDGERFVTGETLAELEARLPQDMFFRSHKSYIVNINHIDSITPYGRWTYIVRLRGTKRDALITGERFEALQKVFG